MTFVPDIPLVLLVPIACALLGVCVWRFVVERSARVAWVRRTLMALIVVAMVARPGVPGGEVPTGSINVNVFLLIDTSQSIAAEDFGEAPRIDGVRKDVRDIAFAFAGSNISVITFDSQPQLRVPLTDDGSAVIEMVNALKPEAAFHSRGTSISIARDMLRTEIERADAAHPGAPTVVFYLGDGEQTSEEAPESFDTVASLVDAGLVLGYGTEAGGRMLEHTYQAGAAPTYLQDPAGGDAISRIDEGALRDIAQQLGTTYLHRDPAVDLAPSLEAMTQTNGEVDMSTYEESRLDLSWVLAVPLFALMTWELFAFVRALVRVRAPGRAHRPNGMP